jgi:hypothetical protein
VPAIDRSGDPCCAEPQHHHSRQGWEHPLAFCQINTKRPGGDGAAVDQPQTSGCGRRRPDIDCYYTGHCRGSPSEVEVGVRGWGPRVGVGVGGNLT